MEHDINPSVVKYSLAAKAMDTANMVATQMQVQYATDEGDSYKINAANLSFFYNFLDW